MPGRLINTLTRAWEIFEGKQLDRRRGIARRPILTLRHINELKRMKAAQRAKHAQRLALYRLMYGQDDAAERDLGERAAELDQRQRELRLKEIEADIKKAIDDAEIDQKARQRLHQMAMADLRRRQKNSRRHEQPAKPAWLTESITG